MHPIIPELRPAFPRCLTNDRIFPTMEWLNRRNAFSDAELSQFDFCPGAAFFTPTVYIQRPDSVSYPDYLCAQVKHCSSFA